MSGTEPAPKPETPDPTLPAWSRGLLAIGNALGGFVRAVLFRSQGQSTYAWCWIGGVGCVLWLLYHPPGWISGLFGAARAVGAESGEAVGSVVGIAVFAAIAALRRAMGQQPPQPPYQQPGVYQPPPRPQYPPPQNPYPSLDNRPPPGGQGWAQ